MTTTKTLASKRYTRSRAIKNILLFKIVEMLHKSNKKWVTEPGRDVRQLAIYSSDFVSLNIQFFKQYEKEELETLLVWLRDSCDFNGCALDIGANLGNHSLFFSEHFRKVFSFEPHKTTYRLLKINTENSANITAFNTGLSDAKGESIMHTHPANMAGAHLSEYSQDVGLFDSEDRNQKNLWAHQIELNTLDSMSGQIDCPVSLVKIDVEGHELAVLRGGRDLIASQQPTILFEQHVKDFANGSSPVIDFLRTLGYTRFMLLKPSLQITDFQDAGILDVVVALAKAAVFGLTYDVVEKEDFEPDFYPFLIASSTRRNNV